MADWVSILESAYELEPRTDAWFGRLLDTARPLLGDGRVIGGFLFSHGGRDARIDAAVVRGTRSDEIGRFERLIREGSSEALLLALGSGAPLFGSLSECLFAAIPQQETLFIENAGPGVPDCEYFVAPSAQQSFVVVAASLSEPRRTSALQRERWTRIAAHVGAGLRLRAALESVRASEAVLDAEGRLLDASSQLASGSARQVLRDAVRRREHARTRNMRSDPDGALDLWQGLVAGRWSLLDRFESDGRRFVVALRNDPEVGDLRGLSRRERQIADYLGMGRSQKEIAYALGVTQAAVSNSIRRACRKLGIVGPSQLASFFAPRGVRTQFAAFDLGGSGTRTSVSTGRTTGSRTNRLDSPTYSWVRNFSGEP
jgi:DNA-binding CsgD family transcriptional regulator